MAGGGKAKIVASRISWNRSIKVAEDRLLAQAGRPVRSDHGVKVT